MSINPRPPEVLEKGDIWLMASQLGDKTQLKMLSLKFRRVLIASKKLGGNELMIFSCIILRFPLYIQKCVAFGKIFLKNIFGFGSYCQYPAPPALHLNLDYNYNFWNTLLCM